MELPGPRRSVRCIKRKRFDDFETDEESVLAPNYPLEARQHLPLMRLLWVAELANAGIPLGNTCAQSDRQTKRQRTSKEEEEEEGQEEEMECEEEAQEAPSSSCAGHEQLQHYSDGAAQREGHSSLLPQPSFSEASQVRHSSPAEHCTRAGAQAHRRPSTLPQRVATNHQRPARCPAGARRLHASATAPASAPLGIARLQRAAPPGLDAGRSARSEPLPLGLARAQPPGS